MRDLDPQTVALLAGLLLLSAVALVWRGPYASPGWPLVLQGAALAGLVAAIGVAERDPRTLAVAGLVLALKAWVLPRLIVGAGVAARPRAGTGRPVDADRLSGDPTARLLVFAGLVVSAYLLARPVAAVVTGPAGRALPVATSLILVGLLLLVTGRRARGQLVGFLVLDNGIAATAFLATGGVPLVVELGVSLDVLLVVLVLNVLSGRIHTTAASLDPDQLRELHD